jgi:hypothetical protein
VDKKKSIKKTRRKCRTGLIKDRKRRTKQRKMWSKIVEEEKGEN